MRLMLGLLFLGLAGCGGADSLSGLTPSADIQGGGAGAGAGAVVAASGAGGTPSSSAGAAGVSAGGTPGAGGAPNASGAPGQGGSMDVAGAPRAGASVGGMSSAGAGAGGNAGASSGIGGSTGGAGAADAGGAACVPRKACLNAGVIVDNCIPCDENHCGVYSDGCSSTVDCGTCTGTENYCSDSHACVAAAMGCSASRGLYGEVCVQYPSDSTTMTVFCPSVPASTSCILDAGTSCWKCNGAQ